MKKMPAKSLRGKLVVVTRSVEAAGPWIKYLEARGAAVYSFPTIEIVPAKLTPNIKKILKNIAGFDWVVFTSAAGVRTLKERTGRSATEKSMAKKFKIDISPARMPKIAVVGDATAKAVRAAGYRVAFQPSTSASAALAFELDPVRGRSILLLRTTIASPDLRDVLTARGGNVTELPIYKTVLRRDPDLKFISLLESGQTDFLTFASPSAVRGFFERLRFNKNLIKRARALPVIAIGPSVVVALKKAGFKNIRVAGESGIEGMSNRLNKTMRP